MVQIWKKALAGSMVVASSTVVAFSPFGLTRSQPSTPLMMARMRNSRAPPVIAQKPPMNEEITAPELRVTTPSPKGKDEALGIMSLEEALAKAKEMGGLDLIMMNPNSDPPVCKIADYSKYRYMQEKKAKEVKKNSKATEIKEIKMSYKIDVHDYQVRKKNAIKFLNQGNRVKCTVMFRGREVQHDNLGFELLENLVQDMEDVCVREGRPKREGRNLSVIVSPKPEVLKKVNENRKKEDKAKKNKRKERLERKAAEAAAAAAAVAEGSSSSAANADDTNGLKEDNDDDNDVEGSIESSLDELFGSDDLTDDLFG